MSTKKKVHVVWAAMGEYSDRTEWLVKAYAHKAAAEQHARKAEEFAAKTHRKVQEDYGFSLERGWNPHDPEALTYISYTGIHYVVVSIPFSDARPTPDLKETKE